MIQDQLNLKVQSEMRGMLMYVMLPLWEGSVYTLPLLESLQLL